MNAVNNEGSSACVIKGLNKTANNVIDAGKVCDKIGYSKMGSVNERCQQ